MHDGLPRYPLYCSKNPVPPTYLLMCSFSSRGHRCNRILGQELGSHATLSLGCDSGQDTYTRAPYSSVNQGYGGILTGLPGQAIIDTIPAIAAHRIGGRHALRIGNHTGYLLCWLLGAGKVRTVGRY